MMYKTKGLFQALEKKRKNAQSLEDSAYWLAGVEIKRRRILLALTLKELTRDLCSPSYGCKIEKNQIRANQFVLKELYRRLNLSDQQIDMMQSLYERLLFTVNAYVNGEWEKLNKIVHDGYGLENYRFQLILFIHSIANNDYSKADAIFKEMIKLIDDMYECDMVIFSIFSSILMYKQKKYEETVEVLLKTNGLVLFEDLEILRKKYLFLASSMLDYPETQLYYQDANSYYISLVKYDLVDEMNYIMAIYLIKRRSKSYSSEMISLIQDETRKNSLYIFDAFLNQDYEQMRYYRDKPKNEFAEALYSVLYGMERQAPVYFVRKPELDEIDYSVYFLRYISITDSDEKLEFLEKCFSYYKNVKDVFVVRYFLKCFRSLSMRKSKYKAVAEKYEEFEEYL